MTKMALDFNFPAKLMLNLWLLQLALEQNFQCNNVITLRKIKDCYLVKDPSSHQSSPNLLIQMKCLMKKTDPLLLSKVYMPKLSPTKRLSNIKVIESPPLLFCSCALDLSNHRQVWLSVQAYWDIANRWRNNQVLLAPNRNILHCKGSPKTYDV